MRNERFTTRSKLNVVRTTCNAMRYTCFLALRPQVLLTFALADGVPCCLVHAPDPRVGKGTARRIRADGLLSVWDRRLPAECRDERAKLQVPEWPVTESACACSYYSVSAGSNSAPPPRCTFFGGAVLGCTIFGSTNFAVLMYFGEI